MSLPALRAIRRRYPDAGITVLAKPWVASLYEGERPIDRVMTFEGASGARDWSAKWNLIRRLREGREKVRDCRRKAAGDRSESWRRIRFGEALVAGALRRIGGAPGGGNRRDGGCVRVGRGAADLRGGFPRRKWTQFRGGDGFAR